MYLDLQNGYFKNATLWERINTFHTNKLKEGNTNQNDGSEADLVLEYFQGMNNDNDNQTITLEEYQHTLQREYDEKSEETSRISFDEQEKYVSEQCELFKYYAGDDGKMDISEFRYMVYSSQLQEFAAKMNIELEAHLKEDAEHLEHELENMEKLMQLKKELSEELRKPNATLYERYYDPSFDRDKYYDPEKVEALKKEIAALE